MLAKAVGIVGVLIAVFIISKLIISINDGKKAFEEFKNGTASYNSHSSASGEYYSISDLEIELLDSNKNDDYIKLAYRITNDSENHTFEFVEVKISLLDSYSNVLTSDSTYAVGAEGLEPGDSKEFDAMIQVPLSGEVEYFRCTILDYD